MVGRRDAPVLISGCSSGIGRATALHLRAKDWNVYATARKPEAISDLAAAGCKTLPLDVTDSESIHSCVGAIEEEDGPIGALINNAGYGLHGAVETTSLDDVRQQIETNLLGLAALTQAVLPGMRTRRSGRIVNISSIGGRLTFPGGAFYHASKHGVEALSDALRFELRPFGIHVIVIEPGLIKTRFGDTAISTVGEGDRSDAYESFNSGLQEKIRTAYEGVMGRFVAVGPEKVAAVIGKALEASHPRTRYVTPFNVRMLLAMRRLTGDRMWDALLRSQYPSPKPD